jgi:hypothetical protein
LRGNENEEELVVKNEELRIRGRIRMSKLSHGDTSSQIVKWTNEQMSKYKMSKWFNGACQRQVSLWETMIQWCNG